MANFSRWKCVRGMAVSSVGAFAAEQGEAAGGAGNPHTNDVFRWINFAILAAFFIWLFWKKLGPWFRKNAEKISAAISSSAQVKAEAERKLREAESKLANLQNETAKLRAESQRESAAEAQRIRAATRSDQQKVARGALRRFNLRLRRRRHLLLIA